MAVQAYQVDSYDQQLILLKELINQITIESLPNKETATIGIIAKKHNSLESVATLLNSYNIPIKYERSDNILEYTHIKWIVCILRFCLEFQNVGEYKKLDPLVQDIVSFPFFGVNSIALFDLASLANAVKKIPREEGIINNKEYSYLSSMLEYQPSELLTKVISQESANQEQILIQDIAKWLIDLATRAPSLSLGQILDIILGVEEDETRKGYQIEEQLE